MKNKVLSFLRKFNILDIFMLSGGMAIAQALSLLTQPIATRLYSPDQFGTLSLIREFGTMLSACACLQYEMTIITAPDDKEANHTTALCFWLLLFTTAIFSVFIVLYNLFGPSNAQLTGGYLYISILFFFFIGLVAIITAYNKRLREYKLLSTVSVYSSFVHTALKLGLGWLKTGNFGLIFSDMFTHIGGLRFMLKPMLKNRKEIMSARFSDMKRIFKKNIYQPLYQMPGMFITSYSYSIIPFYLTTLYGNFTEVGLYSQATMILLLPLSIVGSNISTVFFNNATREYNETGSYRKSLRKAVLLLSAIAIPVYSAIYILSPWAFPFFFGERWARSGQFAQILCFWHMIRFTSTSIDCALIIEKKQNVGLIFRIGLLVSSVAIFFVCKTLALPIERFLSITSFVYGLFYLSTILLVYRYAFRKKKAVSE